VEREASKKILKTSSESGISRFCLSDSKPIDKANNSVRSNDDQIGFESFETQFEMYACTSTDESETEDVQIDIRRELASWSCRNNISHNALNELLEMLQKCNLNVPKVLRTLLQTPTNVVLENILGDQFYYFGILKGIVSRLSLGVDLSVKSFTINVGVDGLPISRSSNKQLWPIMGLVNEVKDKRPFIIAIFFGETKPKSVDLFLHRFIHEVHGRVSL